MPKYMALDTETKGLGGEFLGFSYAYRMDGNLEAWAQEWQGQDSVEHINMLLRDHTPVFANAKYDIPLLRAAGVDIPFGKYEDALLLDYLWDTTHKAYGLDACCERAGLRGKVDFTTDWSEWTDEMEHYAREDARATLELWEYELNRAQTDPRVWKLYQEVERPYIECLMQYEATGFKIDLPLLDRLIPHLEKKSHRVGQRLYNLVGVIPEIGWDAGLYVKPPVQYSYQTQLTGPMVYRDIEETVKDELLHLLPYYDVVRKNKKSTRVLYKAWVFVETADAPSETVGYTLSNGVKTFDHCVIQPYNPASGLQTAWVLLHKFGYELTGRTETGRYSVDGDTLAEIPRTGLAGKLGTLQTTLADVNKMLSSFLYKFKDNRAEDGRLKTSFNQTVTLTGRLSSSGNINLQNIPARGNYGSLVRSLCIAGEGYQFFSGDLSNIEARVLAHYLYAVMGDPKMSDIFASGVDFHQANADTWGVSRDDAKRALYGIIFGIGAEKLGDGDKERGQWLIDSVNTNAPAIQLLKEKVWEQCERNGGVIHGWFGRRFNYPNIVYAHAKKEARKMIAAGKAGDSVNRVAKGLVAQAKRQVFNAMLQGTAATINKMVGLVLLPYSLELGVLVGAAVHDEVSGEVPVENADTWNKVYKEVASMVYLSHVVCDGASKTGANWAIH